ncbi:MAG: hypothetical protein KGM91_04500 [Burkholderiales bacterium]|nr:hypothetical protein [Burkholderiales bacterium]
MTKQCAARGCTREAAGFSKLCEHHKQIQRRHGDPAQAGITVHRLKPYVQRVEDRKAKNRDSTAWALLDARWDALVIDARGTLAMWERGTAMSRSLVKAASQVVTIADNAPAPAVVSTALAMFLMRDAEPRRFASDRAFDFQLVRRVRALAPVNAGSYWDQKERRTKKVYRDLPPKVTEVMGQQFREAFGLAGIMLADKARAEAAKAEQAHQLLAQALEELA